MKYVLFLTAFSLIQAQSSQQPQGQSPPLLPITGPLPPPGSQSLPGEAPQGIPTGPIPAGPQDPRILAQGPPAEGPILLPQGAPVGSILPQPSQGQPQPRPQGSLPPPIQGEPIDPRIAGPPSPQSQGPPRGPIVSGPPQTQPGSAPPSQELIDALGQNGVLSKPIPPRRISDQQFTYFLSRVRAQALLGSGPPSRASLPVAGGPAPVNIIQRPPPTGATLPPGPLPPSQPQPIQQRPAVLPPPSPSAQGLPGQVPPQRRR